MKFSSPSYTAAVLAVVALHHVSYGEASELLPRSLRGTQTTTRSQEHRVLSSENAAFVPLSCNSPRCNKGNTNWRRENYNPLQGTVVIPCGSCVTMNYNEEDKLVLPHGLDIQGELIFPENYRLEIETPFILVQGKLVMSDTTPVTGNPNIKITLTGGDASVTNFVPAGENERVCSAESDRNPVPCVVGAKAITVAGGQLDIQAMRSSCKTWVHLEDVAFDASSIQPSEFLQLPDTTNHPVPSCRSKTSFIDADFSNAADIGDWSGNGAPFEITSPGTLRVFDRTSITHGPTVSLLDVRDCLDVDHDYLLTARVRLLDRTVPLGTNSECAETGSNCLTVQTRARLPSGGVGSGIGAETPGNLWKNGEWNDLHFVVRFREEELSAGATFHLIRMVGPSENVEIEIDSLELALPPPLAFPDPSNVCGGNLIRNGDASLSAVHPFPFEANRSTLDVRTTSSGNNYFSVTGREGDRNGIVYFLGAPGCVVPSAKYRFSAVLRMQSSVPIAWTVVLRATLESGAVSNYEVALCPPSSRSWVSCESEFLVPLDFPAEQVQSLRLSIETVDGPTIPYICDRFSFELIDGFTDGIIVSSDGVEECWEEGSEILITSHTVEMDSAQVRRLRASPVSVGEGLVRLPLDSNIMPPISKRDGDFAVEVALLSRSIVFEGATDESDSLMGGHLIVFHTPNIAQTLAGVELFNFGRQGELGRYPIHFHMSENVEGSLVEKNSIHHSNQRAVVIHGSHNVTVNENVAFEILGHTFMTEDGGEMDNVFTRNLGASTRPVDRLVRSFETDKSSVSTFWISNPVNEFVGNVAAGSHANGFWYELQTAVRSPTSLLSTSAGMNPRRLPLTLFRDNVAHSNRIHGLRTYPFGLEPPKQAIFHNTSSYKNRRDGIFFHNSFDLAIVGGVLADNELHADFDLADDIEMRDTKLIGLSPSYRRVIETQPDAFAHRDEVIGIELHSFLLDETKSGSTISNVKFESFVDTFNSKVSLIKVEPGVKLSGRFDYWTSVANMDIETGVGNVFDFQGALEIGVTDSYVVDLDGSMNPAGSLSRDVSTAVVDTPEMKAFLDLRQCIANNEGASLYCSGTCISTILFSTDPSPATEDLLLRITSTTTGVSFAYPGKFFTETTPDGEDDDVENASMFKRRLFSASLPKGSYRAEFVDADGSSSWPGSVEATLEPSACDSKIQYEDVDLQIPHPTTSVCSGNLIRNGKMESGMSPWLQSRGSIGISDRGGVGGSAALVDNGEGPRNAALGQFLDARCLIEGAEFDVRVSVRLTSGSTVISCESGGSCPGIYFRVWEASDADGAEFTSHDILITNSFVSKPSLDGWQILSGHVTVDSRVAAATSVSIVVDRDLTGITMALDDFSMTPVETSCDTIIRNGAFSDGMASFWTATGGELVLETIDGNPALALHNRRSAADTMVQDVQTGCFVESERYMVTARLRFLRPNLTLFNCDPTERGTETSCPRIRLRSTADNGSARTHFGGSIALTDHGVTSDGWYTVSGLFHATSFDADASAMMLSLVEAPDRKSLVMDDVVVEPMSRDCGQLLINGNAEMGDTAMFWTTYVTNGHASIDLVVPPNGNNNSGNGQAFQLSNRENFGDGISQVLDHRCLSTVGSKFRLSARMQLLDSRGVPTVCNPASTRLADGCPPVRIIGLDADGVRIVEQRFNMNDRDDFEWEADAMNLYQVDIEVSELMASCDRILFSIRTFNLDWDLVVDDMTLVPLS